MRAKQAVMDNMPAVDEMYAQGEAVLGLRRKMQDLKDDLAEEGKKLISLMRDKRKYKIKVNGITISVKDVEAKEVLSFSEKD